MEAVGDGGRVAEVVIIVKDGIGEGRSHVADVLGLCDEVQDTVLHELEDIGLAVRTVEVDVALVLVHEGLVAHSVEFLPDVDEVLDNADVGTGLDVEVTGIEEAAYIEAGDEFEGLVFGVGGGTLPVEVEVVGGGGSLEITLLEGFAVPDAVAFVDRDVVHMDRDPDVAGGICHPVIYGAVDNEVAGLVVAVLDVVDAGLADGSEVELEVLVLVVVAPEFGLAGECLGGAAVGIDAAEGGLGERTPLTRRCPKASPISLRNPGSVMA